MELQTKKRSYLGDGLYVYHDGYHFVLETPRKDGTHRVALEPDVLSQFFLFIEKTCSVKITVEQIEDSDSST